MSDADLETICITGSRPPYKKAAWVIGEVAEEIRAQTSPGKQRISEERKTHLRPKSTPSRLNVSFVGPHRSRCARFGQVYSAKDRKSLEGPLPEESTSTIVLSPGYVLSRSKEKINMTIKTDDFFSEQKTNKSHRKRLKPPDEKDVRINQLVTQVDDLTLLLEEERLNHKFQARKNVENNKMYVEQIHQEHREHIMSIENDHADDIERLKEEFEQQMQQERSLAEAEKARIQTELETLQGAFEAYKVTVATEMDYKWERRENEIRYNYEKQKEDAMTELRKELLHDKNKEIDAINKEHQRQIMVLVDDHAKEVDRLMEKFAEYIQDSENLKKVLTQMQAMTQENTELKEKIKTVSEKLKKTQTDLENKKVKLAGYEEHFAEKVAEVDNKYSMRMHGLMSDNTELRHHYMKKVEEVLRLQSEETTKQDEALHAAKDTMQAIIMARTKSNVSLTALRTESEQHRQHSKNNSSANDPAYLERRSSLPTTREELSIALQRSSKIEKLPRRPKTPTLAELGAAHKPRPHTSHYAKQTSPRAAPCSARVGPSGSFHPTEVNISDQGIRNLKLP
ncbi:flagellum-associated coiled-coil domain-containing protein 1-like [Actinia tenebrosa]|uniref:Flagellum-associated coiled-coil domain-containing protein 1-like n=1 Tax=Actinia tenebrosa TaxID=6105 RepID=A0A6P8HUW5_ACTTE|nr:flagellum-associated coiled-coil domain-containing protein 1-like [Actinia tenebrosa]